MGLQIWSPGGFLEGRTKWQGPPEFTAGRVPTDFESSGFDGRIWFPVLQGRVSARLDNLAFGMSGGTFDPLFKSVGFYQVGGVERDKMLVLSGRTAQMNLCSQPEEVQPILVTVGQAAF